MRPMLFIALLSSRTTRVSCFASAQVCAGGRGWHERQTANSACMGRKTTDRSNDAKQGPSLHSKCREYIIMVHDRHGKHFANNHASQHRPAAALHQPAAGLKPASHDMTTTTLGKKSGGPPPARQGSRRHGNNHSRASRANAWQASHSLDLRPISFRGRCKQAQHPWATIPPLGVGCAASYQCQRLKTTSSAPRRDKQMTAAHTMYVAGGDGHD